MNNELRFEIMAGKKTPKEMIDAMAGGYKEAYRLSVKGGYEVVLSKHDMGLIDGGRKMVQILDAMPPEETMPKGSEPAQVEFKTRKGKVLSGMYGICDGKKFFVEGKVAKSAKPKARKSAS